MGRNARRTQARTLELAPLELEAARRELLALPRGAKPHPSPWKRWAERWGVSRATLRWWILKGAPWEPGRGSPGRGRGGPAGTRDDSTVTAPTPDGVIATARRRPEGIHPGRWRIELRRRRDREYYEGCPDPRWL